MFAKLIREVVQAEAVNLFTKTAQQSSRWLILGSDILCLVLLVQSMGPQRQTLPFCGTFQWHPWALPLIPSALLFIPRLYHSSPGSATHYWALPLIPGLCYSSPGSATHPWALPLIPWLCQSPLCACDIGQGCSTTFYATCRSLDQVFHLTHLDPKSSGRHAF